MRWSELQIVVIIACHNRKALTSKCVQALINQENGSDVSFGLDLILVDDGSTDGTADLVKQLLPRAKIICGDGSFFWAKSMAVAEKAALKMSFSHLIWLNDDNILDSDAFARLIRISRENPLAIIVGATRDPVSGALTYGGLNKMGYHPQRFKQVPKSPDLQQVDTFNGNLVFIPRKVHDRVGLIDGDFSHSYADIDYGLRARLIGIPILQAPGTFGRCARSKSTDETRFNIYKRWKFLESPKGLPFRCQRRFLKKHGGKLWLLFLLGGYLKRLIFGKKN